MEAVGHNRTSLARAAGLNLHYVRQWLNGRVRSPGSKKLQRVAEILGVTLDELTTPAALVAPDGARRVIHIGPSDVLTVRGKLQAAWLENDGATEEQGAYGAPLVDDPRFPPARQWLERVTDDSSDRVFPEGTLLHVVDARQSAYAPRDGDFVVVVRHREGDLIERTVRRVSIAAGKTELLLHSHNPKWAAPLALTPDAAHAGIEIAALVIGSYRAVRS